MGGSGVTGAGRQGWEWWLNVVWWECSKKTGSRTRRRTGCSTVSCRHKGAAVSEGVGGSGGVVGHV